MATDQKAQQVAPYLRTLSEWWESQRTFYEAGVDAALYDALQLARDSGLSPPEWVIEGALDIVGCRLKSGPAKGKGKTAYYKAMRRYHRWQAVRKAKDRGATWVDAYGEASEVLTGTFAEGGNDLMKKDYQQVQKDLKDPKKALQYYGALRDAQIMTGTPMLSLG